MFEHAWQETEAREPLAAALLHDEGKGFDSRLHAESGADLLAELMSERVKWHVRHHLDLLRESAHAMQLCHGPAVLDDLERSAPLTPR